jgi:hypothetical protein
LVQDFVEGVERQRADDRKPRRRVRLEDLLVILALLSIMIS